MINEREGPPENVCQHSISCVLNTARGKQEQCF